ncbi:hypothetical protein, partial [Myceligenerans halotolerans]
ARHDCQTKQNHASTVSRDCHAERDLNRQRRELERLARELRSQPVEVVELPVVDFKERRRARREQNWLHKPVRVGAAAA